MKRHLLILIMFFVAHFSVSAQETIYTATNIYSNVKIRDYQPDFVEYRLLDNEYSKENYFLKKKDILAIVNPDGFHEIVIHDDAEHFHSIYYWVNNLGDTLRVNINYDPTAHFETDPKVKLCRFRNDSEYGQLYGKWNHIYFNDPEKKFTNARQLIFKGVDFSCMRLVNAKEISKAILIKNRYLSRISQTINSSKFLTPMSFERKIKVIEEMKESENSYKSLDSISWVSDKDYKIDVRKIPAIIKSLSFSHNEGIALLFLVEKFSKADHELSGYWVAFDLSDRKTLLIDYILAERIGSQSTGFGWDNYWLSALTGAGAYDPYTFYKYLDLEKKGKVDFVCD
jgi:hypothetical protein